MMTSSTWQHGSLIETNLHMLENQLLCDITFLVGDEQVAMKCHKYMLVSRSPVFYTMFCGAMAETSDTVMLPDVEPDIWSLFLRCLYGGRCEIDGSTVLRLLYVAKKYDIPDLATKCNLFLTDNVDTDNVCIVLDQAITFEETELKQNCLSVISKETSKVFNSPSFLSLSCTGLKTVLELDNMSIIGEGEVYLACRKWATANCKPSLNYANHTGTNDENKAADSTPKLNTTERSNESNDCVAARHSPHDGKPAKVHTELRQALGECLSLIRFPTMPIKMFVTIVSKDDILTAEEKLTVIEDIVLGESRSKYPSTKRTRSVTFDVERLVEIPRADGWSHSGKQDGISFTVSTPVVLEAVALYLPAKKGDVRGTVEILEDENIVESMEVTLHYQPNEPYQYIPLHNHIHLTKDVNYSIRQRLAGTSTYYGKKASGKQIVHDTEIVFKNLCVGTSDNSTSLTNGQIHGIRLKKSLNS